MYHGFRYQTYQFSSQRKGRLINWSLMIEWFLNGIKKLKKILTKMIVSDYSSKTLAEHSLSPFKERYREDDNQKRKLAWRSIHDLTTCSWFVTRDLTPSPNNNDINGNTVADCSWTKFTQKSFLLILHLQRQILLKFSLPIAF